jgi:predicted metal-dependent phosphoesterase TrpH
MIDLHTHTHASDGSDRPDEVEDWPSQHGPDLRRSLQALVARHGLLATVLV